MLTGMLTQMVCGNSAGLVSTYELHVVFRCLSAMTCALMYTSGQTICKCFPAFNIMFFFLTPSLYFQWLT